VIDAGYDPPFADGNGDAYGVRPVEGGGGGYQPEY